MPQSSSTKPSPMAAEISLRLIFLSGDREFDAGVISFDPSIGFDKLRSLLADHIGADHHHISILLCCRKSPRSPDIRRRIPIQNNSDVAAIARESNCLLYVVWKPPPPRRRAPPPILRRDTPPPPIDSAPTILRRSTPPPIEPRLGVGFVDYETRIGGLQRQGGEINSGYPMHTVPYTPDRTPRGADTDTKRPVCNQCLSQQRPLPFHSCVNDPIVVGFRTRFGPIQRPSKSKFS